MDAGSDARATGDPTPTRLLCGVACATPSEAALACPGSPETPPVQALAPRQPAPAGPRATPATASASGTPSQSCAIPRSPPLPTPTVFATLAPWRSPAYW